MPPVYFGKDFRYLVPSKFRSKLIGSRVYTRNGWSKAAKEYGIFFDLSKVEWVELEPVVQIILLIERALKEEISVTIAMPLPRARQSEEKWIRSNPQYAPPTQTRIQNRIKALNFLNYLRFQQALRVPHLQIQASNLRILDNYDSSLSFSEEYDEKEFTENAQATEEVEYHYEYYYPLDWLSSEEPKLLSQMADFIADILRKKDEIHYGVEAVDANTIANVFLYELIDNVGKYAGDGCRALATARIRSENISPRSKDYLQSHVPYIQWLTQKKTSLVEIVLGDSGAGIISTLEKSYREAADTQKAISKTAPNETAAIMLWAFDRWSSCNRDQAASRGTRGLYRVHRIVKKYQGIITLRSGNQVVGFDHGGLSYDSNTPYPGRLSYIPGTVLSLWLPPFRENVIPRRTLMPITKQREFGIVTLDLDNEGLNVRQEEELTRILNRDIIVVANARGVHRIESQLKKS